MNLLTCVNYFRRNIFPLCNLLTYLIEILSRSQFNTAESAIEEQKKEKNPLNVLFLPYF